MRKELIAHKNPKSPISEIFRTLRTNMQFMDVNRKMKTLLITSTFAGEGKSWVTSNLAVTFAQAGKKVILVDADMRKGRQYSIFGISPKPGLSNYLSTAEIDEQGKSTESLNNYIQETEVDNLYVISSGNVPPNPSELLVSAQMMSLIEELKTLCDIVIFDGTPCELVADSIILSRIVDSTLIVTAHKQTKKDALDRVIKNIQNVGGKIVGIVLNKMPVQSKEYGYYYGRKNTETKKNVIKKMDKFNERIDKNIIELQKDMIDIKPNSENIITQEMDKQPEEDKNIQESNLKPGTEKKDIKDDNSIKDSNNNDNFLEKTNEILKQINEYIDSEKNKAN